MTPQKILFIDRDGTLILETNHIKIDLMEQVVFYPEVFYWLGKIVREFDYQLVLVTNQDGLGTAKFPNEPFFTTHRFIMKTFENEKIIFKEEHIDKSYPAERLNTRKPNTGMLTHFFASQFDLKNSLVIGDRITDVMLAKNLGCKACWLNNGSNLGVSEISETAETLKPIIAVNSPDWENVYGYLKRQAEGSTTF